MFQFTFICNRNKNFQVAFAIFVLFICNLMYMQLRIGLFGTHPLIKNHPGSVFVLFVAKLWDVFIAYNKGNLYINQ